MSFCIFFFCVLLSDLFPDIIYAQFVIYLYFAYAHQSNFLPKLLLLPIEEIPIFLFVSSECFLPFLAPLFFPLSLKRYLKYCKFLRRYIQKIKDLFVFCHLRLVMNKNFFSIHRIFNRSVISFIIL